MHMTYVFLYRQDTLHHAPGLYISITTLQGYRDSHSSKGIRRYNAKTLPAEIATHALLILFQTSRTHATIP